MDRTPVPLRLADTAFPGVLADIWRKKRSGRLTAAAREETALFAFEKGGLVVERKTFPDRAFLDALLRDGRLDAAALDRAESQARETGASLFRAAMQTGILPPPRRLWPLLEAFVKESLYSWFDRSEGTCVFEESRPGEPAWIRDISLAAVILEGIRRLPASGRLVELLPEEDEPLQLASACQADVPGLDPHERYLLRALETPRSLRELCAGGDLPAEDCRRAAAAFLVLGLAAPAQARGRNARPAAELSLTDLDRLISAFNEKCACVHRYLTKELGPVALSILDKAVDEIRGRLDPAVQGLVLRPDGRFELRSALRLNVNVSTEDARRAFLRGLDEIIAAEVLAVRRNLGGGSEGDLVRLLEKQGDGP